MQSTPKASCKAFTLDEATVSHLTFELEDSVQRTANYLLQTADCARTDRLWPADSLVFNTNPLSVAYGACGPMLFLHRANLLGAEWTNLRTWITDKPLSEDDYPPGLYLGLAGIACTLWEIGLHENSVQAMKALYRSSLLYNEPNMLLGSAGWGWASLQFFGWTGEQTYLDWAVRAGEHILETATVEGDAYYWQSGVDSRTHYGFGYGGSGISLFLAHLYQFTNANKFREASISGMETELNNGTETDLGVMWQRFEGDTLVTPYMLQGSAGVGSTAIRLSQLLGVQHFHAAARGIADSSYVKYTVSPGLFHGLSGVVEFMLDMFRFTDESAYWYKSLDMAETIMWFRILKGDGMAWPGRWLDRISNDYATGGAGIGLLFERLLSRRDRPFWDIRPLS